MGRIWTRQQLKLMGWSDARIARETGAGIRRLAHGVYGPNTDAPAWELYRERILAAATTCGAVVSHQSAAALHGIPVLHPDRSLVHFTVDRMSGGGRRRGLHIHPRPLPADQVTVVDGVRVTTRCRTAIDVAMSGDVDRGVCAIDAVRLIRRYPSPIDPPPVELADLTQCLALLSGRTGAFVARRAVELSVDRSESAGESWSRMQILAAGLPMPRLQVPRTIEGETYVADFDWGPMTGEFDGRGKYGADPAEVDSALADEKRRHAAFAASGVEVVRWQWRELAAPNRLRDILTPALVRNGLLAVA
ncbi:hypothetical protein [Tsukamurella strandjordii]|uniref:hypothetical protein n=1 Tax=Tsukamurella strandjordii TaxID=147577 RepID=UPI0031D97469